MTGLAVRTLCREPNEPSGSLRAWPVAAALVIVAVLLAAASALGSTTVSRQSGVIASAVTGPQLFRVDLRKMTRGPIDPARVAPSRSLRQTSEADRAPSSDDGGGRQDPLLRAQRQAVMTKNSSPLAEPQLGFAGLDFTGVNPAGVGGEPGVDQYLQLVNGPGGAHVAVFSKVDGALLAGPVVLSSLWAGSGGCSEGWGNASVVFDREAERWVIVEQGRGNHLCVYASLGPDAVAGGWLGMVVETVGFPETPRVAVWSESYIITTAEAEPAVYALRRSSLLAGGPAELLRFAAPRLSGFGFQALTAVDADGSDGPPAGSPAVLLRHADGALHGGADRLELFSLAVDWSSPASASLSVSTAIPLSAFDSRLCGASSQACVEQPETAQKLDPVRELVGWAPRYRAFADHEALVGAFTVDADGGDRPGVRWFELRRSGGQWGLHQEGTFSPDGAHRWLGSTALDREGNLVVSYSLSDPAGLAPSMALAGRAAGDPLGVLTQGEITLQAGLGPQTAGLSPQLWGPSGSLAVDPVDDCTFWASNAVGDDGGWTTRVATFAFDGCSPTAGDGIFADDFESGGTGAWSE